MANPGASTTTTPNTVATYNGLQLLFILPFANMAIASQDQQFTRVFGGTTWDPQFITAIWKGGAFATACTSGIERSWLNSVSMGSVTTDGHRETSHP